MKLLEWDMMDKDYDCILGQTWLQAYNPNIDWRSKKIIEIRPTRYQRTNTIHVRMQMCQVKESDHTITTLVQCSKVETTDPPEPIMDILNEFSDVFPNELPNTLPPSRVVDFAITMKPGMRPKAHVGQFRISPTEEKLLEEFCEACLSKGWIKVSNSPWISRIFCVPKRNDDGDMVTRAEFLRTLNEDSKVRWVLDYRYCNSMQDIPKIRLPNIESLFDKMRGAKFFTKLDLATGYHQMLVEPESRKYTAFQTHNETYEWLVAPMGMAGMPGIWSRLMNKLFGKLPFVVVYMDDICICSDTLESHVNHLQQLFAILRQEKLYCRKEKCLFAQHQVEYLGHVISYDGISVDQRKIRAIEKWPRPANQKDLQRWLGLCGYYRKFIYGYAEITFPLGELVKEKVPWIWTNIEDRAFNLLKLALQQAPVLSLPNYAQTFFVTTDASGKCVGAVLSQPNENNDDKPIAFLSKKLSETEQRWPAYEQELFAIKLAFAKWRPYLWGRPFKVFTDNSACKWFLNTPMLNNKMARWLDYFSQFEFEIFHRPGIENVVADCLSRPPETITPVDVTVNHISISNNQPCGIDFVRHHICPAGCDCAVTITCLLRHRRQLNSFLSLNSRDQRILLGNILGETTHVTSPNVPSTQTIRVNHIKELQFVSIKLTDDQQMEYRKAYRKDVAFQKYAKGKRELLECNGLYFIRSEDKQLKLVVPNDPYLRTDAIAQRNDAETVVHPGIRRTQMAVSQWYFWPGLSDDVELYVKSCETCARYKSHRGKNQGLLQPLPIPPTTWHSVAVDWITGLPESNGYDAIMTCTCRLSKRSKYCPSHTTNDAIKCAHEFFDTVVRHHGLPEVITSDRDPKFKSQFWNELMKIMGIRHIKTTSHRAQGDGQSEIVNRLVEDSLRCICSYLGDDWSEHLGTIEYAHSGLSHSTTGITPFEVDTGRKQRNPIASDHISNDYARNFSQRRQELIELAKQNMKKAQERQKKYYDKKRVEIQFNVGDQVLLASRDIPLKHAQVVNNNERPKLVPRWIGPFTIIEKVGSTSYRLDLPTSMKQLETNVFHVERLKHAPNRQTQFDGRPAPKHAPVVLNENGEELHVIESLLKERTFNRKKEFLVKWQNQPDHEASWELEKDIKHVIHFKRLVKEMRERRRQESTIEEV